MKMIKGILAINKPKNWTSFDVVNKIKHILKIRRVGHLGTLDPLATGVLLVTIGRATKLFDFFQEKMKTYSAKFEFGYETDSLDSDGKIVNETDIIPNLNQIKHVIGDFIGEIAQIPPKYSAKSVNGKRAYELARNNIDFELIPKIVKIYNMKILDYTQNILTLNIQCGSGTYIRSICRDLARKLNSYATMIDLTRTSVGKIGVEDCVDIQDLNENNILDSIIKLDVLIDIPIIKFNENQTYKLLNGQTIQTNLPNGSYKLNDDTDTIAIVSVSKNNAKMSLFLN